MNEAVFTLWDVISILGYPLVGWLSYKAGMLAGIEHAVASLHEKGLIELDEEDDEQ